jgi:murein L,D-transpeptidase YafK
LDDSKHKDIKNTPQEPWFNKPIYSGYRRKINRTAVIYNCITHRKTFMDETKRIEQIEFVIINNNHISENDAPIMNYSKDWKKYSCADFLQLQSKERDELISVATVSFSDVEVPKVRRAIKNDPKWFEETIYEKYQDMLEMESLLKKLDEPRLSDHIKKEYNKQGINIRTRMCGWTVIRKFLL